MIEIFKSSMENNILIYDSEYKELSIKLIALTKMQFRKLFNEKATYLHIFVEDYEHLLDLLDREDTNVFMKMKIISYDNKDELRTFFKEQHYSFGIDRNTIFVVSNDNGTKALPGSYYSVI